MRHTAKIQRWDTETGTLSGEYQITYTADEYEGESEGGYTMSSPSVEILDVRCGGVEFDLTDEEYDDLAARHRKGLRTRNYRGSWL